NALMHSQRIGKATPNAVQGNRNAFLQLDSSRDELNIDLEILASGGIYLGRKISPPDAKLAAVLEQATKAWASSDKAADTIIDLRSELLAFGGTLKRLNALTPTLLELTEQISAQKVQGGASAR